MAVLALPAFAQDATPEAMPVPPNAIASGLNNPRGINYDADGNLWIAEAGSGGPTVMMEDPDVGQITVGFSSQVTMVAADGTQVVALPFLFSYGSTQESGGLATVAKQGDSLWLVTSGAGSTPSPFYMDNVFQVNAATGRIQQAIDMYTNEITNNPDEADPPDTNVNNIAWDASGNLYIVDTGANTIFTWTADGGLQPWHIWKDDPVPTAIDFAADGSAYVSFLGTGIAPGAGHIEHLSADGSEVLETFGGLTAVTDVAVGQDGSVYAVQLWSYNDQGPDMMGGSVVMVNADGATPVADGLFMPYSLAQAPDGSWAVSIGTLAGPGNGAVIRLGGDM
ncbi:MAG: ScyD/ScyE family protein [Anaerolineae bacterium]